MNEFLNIMKTATKDFESIKKELDKTIDSIANNEDSEIATKGKTLKAGMKDAFEKRDLTKLQKLLNDGRNN